ncbi:diguanylate cyclase domain-containing protein [Caldimonas brevitalea]|uniref:Diguanylate cyclase n=1 Tax=Caldimonas brevitalea TaxID=413882 RepID=A0A0G3BDY9_9BURK|nr:diguanylate cyclase [Caldimonas brevitalea]AKJ27634.1 diguanylate cyclase [Caldimonas brevitalea]
MTGALRRAGLLWLAVLAATAAVSALAVLQQTSYSAFVERHRQALSDVAALRQADTRWTVQILKVQTGTAANYDALADAGHAVTRARDVVGEAAVSLGVAREAPSLAALREALSNKAEAAESIKSEHAILLNSLRFIPTQLEQLTEELRRQRDVPTARRDAFAALDAARALTLELLRFLSHADSSSHDGLDTSLAHLQAVLQSADSLPDMSASSELLQLHARSVLLHEQQTHRAAAAALQAPTAATVEAVEAQINDVFRDRLKELHRYRVALFALATLLCSAAVYAGLGWWRSYRALAEAHRNLAQQLVETRRLMREAAELSNAATHDALTGIANRRLVEDRLEQAIARAVRTHSGLALVFADLDGFKAVNDEHGHAVGDSLLIEVARRFKHNVRDCDTVGRLGGDEFVLILEEAEAGGAARVAQAVLQDIEAIRRVEGCRVAVSASIGIVGWHADCGRVIDARALLHQADLAMYEAKRAGKGRCCTTILAA